MTTYDEGLHAFRRGVSQDENPYHSTGEDHAMREKCAAWSRGWSRGYWEVAHAKLVVQTNGRCYDWSHEEKLLYAMTGKIMKDGKFVDFPDAV